MQFSLTVLAILLTVLDGYTQILDVVRKMGMWSGMSLIMLPNLFKTQL